MADSSALDALLALLPLDRLPRTGWLLRGVPAAESVAGHLLGSAHVALALGARVEPALDLARVLAMTLVHDLPEAVSGDLPRPAARHLPPGAKAKMEDALAQELAGGLSALALDAWSEYRGRTTREARFAHLCDTLQLGVRLLGYERAGQRGLEEFHAGLVELDASEFEPAEALRRDLVRALNTGSAN